MLSCHVENGLGGLGGVAKGKQSMNFKVLTRTEVSFELSMGKIQCLLVVGLKASHSC